MRIQLFRSLVLVISLSLPLYILLRYRYLSRLTTSMKSINHELYMFLFFLYGAWIASLTIMPLPFAAEASRISFQLNLIPVVRLYDSYKASLGASGPYFKTLFVLNGLGNIIVFMPLGIFLPWLISRIVHLRQVITIAFIISLSIEIIQYISNFWKIYRSADIDDIILNVTGAILGYLIFRAINFLVLRSAPNY